MYEAGFSQDFRNQILMNSDKINEKFRFIREHLHNMINLKNGICKVLAEIYKDFEGIFNWALNNHEFENLFKFYSMFENDKRFSIESLARIHSEKDGLNDQDHVFKDERLTFLD